MLILFCIAVVVVFAIGVIRGSAHGLTDRAEKTFLYVAPLPAIIAFGIPAIMVVTVPGSVHQLPWSLRFDVAAGILSLILLLAGGYLLIRQFRRAVRLDSRLVLGLIVAGLPALLIGLVALLYSL